MSDALRDRVDNFDEWNAPSSTFELIYDLRDRIDALEAENKALREGLAFYANPKTYEGVWDRQFGATVYEIMSDSGRRARALLAKGEK